MSSHAARRVPPAAGGDRGSDLVLAFGVSLLALAALAAALPADLADWISPVDSLYASNALATALVLAAVGRTCTLRLLAARAQGRLALLRSAPGLLVPLLLVQAVVVLAAVVNTRVPGGPDNRFLGLNVRAVAGQRFNLWLGKHLLESRPEFVGLAVVSILVQLVLLVLVVLLVLPARRAAPLTGLLAVVAAAVVAVLRVRAAGVQDPYVLALDTFAVSDAFWVGVATACLVVPFRITSSRLSSSALLVLVGGVLATDFLSTYQAQAFLLPLGAALAGVVLLLPAAPHDLSCRLSESTPVRSLASGWVSWLGWSAVAGPALAARTHEMQTGFRVLVIVLVLVLLVRLTEAALGPLRAWLDRWANGSSGTSRLRDLLAAADARVLEPRAGSAQHRGHDRGAGGEPPAQG